MVSVRGSAATARVARNGTQTRATPVSVGPLITGTWLLSCVT